MKLYLNHTERYPVEQLQMQLFASEPSEFVTAPFAKGENGAVSSLFAGKKYVTATAKITWNGKTGRAAKRLLREHMLAVGWYDIRIDGRRPSQFIVSHG